jgi:outer membrane protein insertion porin family
MFLAIGVGSGSAAVAQGPATAVDTTKKAGVPDAPIADYNAPKRYIVNKVTVSGVKFLDPEIIANTSGLHKGDTIMLPSDYISSAMRKMWSQRYFSDVRILAEPVGDSVNFEIYLQERPRVFKWNIVGVNKSEKSELIDKKLKLKRGSELSEFVINTNSDAIKKYFDEKGFQNAEVSVEQVNDTTVHNAVNVTFVVNKKSRVKIGKISFEGNEVFSDKRLRKTFKKTHQKGINIFRATKLKRKEYEEDKENLLDYYNSRGYRNAVIVKDSIYPINDKRIGISLTVDEGRKFYYRNVSWLGNSVYDTKTLNDMLGVVKGTAYDRKSLHKQLGIGRETNPEEMSVSSLYQNSGYLFSQIEPQEVVVGEDSVDLIIKVYEGKQARVNDVNFTGNYRVDDKVIRRELYVRPGELYDRSMLMATLRQLSQMQHFDPEKLQPNIVPVSNELVDLSFPLEEKASDKFEVSGGWGSGMFVGSVGVQLNNFSIRNLFKGNEWRPYPSGQNQQLAIKGQTNGTYYKAISLNFTEPWLPQAQFADHRPLLFG